MPATSSAEERLFPFSGWSSCDCEKSLSRPAHRNTLYVPPARSPPGCAKDDGAPDHSEDANCSVSKKNQTIHVLYSTYVWK